MVDFADKNFGFSFHSSSTSLSSRCNDTEKFCHQFFHEFYRIYSNNIK